MSIIKTNEPMNAYNQTFKKINGSINAYNLANIQNITSRQMDQWMACNQQ